jgi:hypothetical protein
MYLESLEPHCSWVGSVVPGVHADFFFSGSSCTHPFVGLFGTGSVNEEEQTGGRRREGMERERRGKAEQDVFASLSCLRSI